MPKRKELYNTMNIPRLLYRETIDNWMFAYVHGYRHISQLPVLQVKAGIEQFMLDFGLTEDDYPVDSAITTFYRMLGEVRQIENIKMYDSSKKRN
jgi:hypothetical protein